MQHLLCSCSGRVHVGQCHRVNGQVESGRCWSGLHSCALHGPWKDFICKDQIIPLICFEKSMTGVRGLFLLIQVITLVHTLLSSDHTEQFTSCLVVCPLNTILNWQSEWKKWLEKRDRVPVKASNFIACFARFLKTYCATGLRDGELQASCRANEDAAEVGWQWRNYDHGLPALPPPRKLHRKEQEAQGRLPRVPHRPGTGCGHLRRRSRAQE